MLQGADGATAIMIKKLLNPMDSENIAGSLDKLSTDVVNAARLFVGENFEIKNEFQKNVEGFVVEK